jgi:FkbM family methyltransferase
MNEKYVEPLQAQSELFHASRLTKLVKAPAGLIGSRWAAIRANWLGQGTRKAARTFWGQPMSVVLPDQVSVSLYRYGYVEEGLIRLVLEFLQPGMTFFDIGAHFGFFTLLASSIVGESGQVHSFEPTPSTFAVLQENVAPMKNVRVNNMAMYKEVTTISFNDFGPGLSAFNSLYDPRLSESRKTGVKSTTHQVQATSVDAYVANTGAKPDFIKIDAESAEIDILNGMTKTLAEIRPLVSTEVGDFSIEGTGSSNEIVKRLSDARYIGCEFDGNKVVRHQHQGKYREDNLLFIPQEKANAAGL